MERIGIRGLSSLILIAALLSCFGCSSMSDVVRAIEPIGNDNTKVTVVTKRRITVNVATTLTESTFHRRFAQGGGDRQER